MSTVPSGPRFQTTSLHILGSEGMMPGRLVDYDQTIKASRLESTDFSIQMDKCVKFAIKVCHFKSSNPQSFFLSAAFPRL